MPHIILTGTIHRTEFFERFEASKQERGGWLVRLKDCLLSRCHQLLLVHCTSVRSGFVQDYFLRVEQKGPEVTVRADPHSRIEVNDGVYWAIFETAAALRRANPELVLARDNFPDSMAGTTDALRAPAQAAQ